VANARAAGELSVAALRANSPQEPTCGRSLARRFRGSHSATRCVAQPRAKGRTRLSERTLAGRNLGFRWQICESHARSSVTLVQIRDGATHPVVIRMSIERPAQQTRRLVLPGFCPQADRSLRQNLRRPIFDVCISCSPGYIARASVTATWYSLIQRHISTHVVHRKAQRPITTPFMNAGPHQASSERRFRSQTRRNSAVG
jgi:hypothetical protein